MVMLTAVEAGWWGVDGEEDDHAGALAVAVGGDEECATMLHRHLAVWLGVELAEVVVEMFVHLDGPLFRCQLSEECVWMGCAGAWAARGEAVEQGLQALAFGFKVPVVFHDHAIDGG